MHAELLCRGPDAFGSLRADPGQHGKKIPVFHRGTEKRPAHGPVLHVEKLSALRFQSIKPALEAVRANAGLTICGLALIAPYIDDGTFSLPFPVSTGHWTDHAFQARFRAEALHRPQAKHFRQWLLEQATITRDWLRERTRPERMLEARRKTGRSRMHKGAPDLAKSRRR